jgi:glycosyltransferase involved in cell wall biosynthesis
MRKNGIFIDMPLVPDWEFHLGLEAESGEAWEIKSYVSNEGRANRIANQIRYGKYFYYSFLIFLNRNKYEKILCWQQFYGLLFALYCRIFHVKKTFKLVVMTFIYNKKSGITGHIYDSFMRYIVTSKYIDRLIVFSKQEVAHYAEWFAMDESKFVYVPLGIDKITGLTENQTLREEQYILSVGRSNRDYDFLLDALKGSPYPVKILSNTLHRPSSEKVEIHNNAFNREYFNYLYNCFCVVIPLMNPSISSGQLVILQAMQLGKPIIVTESEGITDYVTDGYNGLIIVKDKQALLAALQRLYAEPELYNRLSINGKIESEKYSVKQLENNIADVIYLDLFR